MFLKNVLHVRVGTLLPRPRTPERSLCVSFVFGGWVLNLWVIVPDGRNDDEWSRDMGQLLERLVGG